MKKTFNYYGKKTDFVVIIFIFYFTQVKKKSILMLEIIERARFYIVYSSYVQILQIMTAKFVLTCNR